MITCLEIVYEMKEATTLGTKKEKEIKESKQDSIGKYNMGYRKRSFSCIELREIQ